MIAEITVDAEALRANVAALRAATAPARFSAVIKANAYGHGTVAVGRALAGCVDAFCVYRVEEAATLRSAGIATPILILGPIEERDLGLAHDCNAAITLWDTGRFRDAAAAVARRRGRAFAVHAKIDTGTTRLGVGPREAQACLAAYLDERDFDLRGAYTHLAAAEELESEFTFEQLACFERLTAPFGSEFVRRGVIRHAAASAAAMLYPRARYDLVRAGIATYGIWPSAATQHAMHGALVLEPALSWTTQLAVVRPVEANTSVGYGCSYRTRGPSRIGVLPIGYSEGLPRAASGRAEVLIDGHRAPLVGRVCMNMTFVDVTHVPQAHPGTRVTLIGRDGADRIDAEDWGRWCDTIGYEIVARLPAEIPRRTRDLAAREAVTVAQSARGDSWRRSR